MNVPDIIRTGISNDTNDNGLLDTMAVYILFTKEAIQIAKTYCEHSGREELSAYDYILGLKTRFKHESFFENTDNFTTKIQNIKDNILQGKLLDALGIRDSEDDDIFWKSQCSCETCSRVNETDLSWNQYIESRRDSLSPLNELIVSAIEDTIEHLP